MSFNLSAKEIFRKRQQFPKGHSSLANAYISSPVVLSNIVYFASLLLLSYRILGALLCFLCTHPAACSRAGNRHQEFHSVPSRVRDRQLTFFFQLWLGKSRFRFVQQLVIWQNVHSLKHVLSQYLCDSDGFDWGQRCEVEQQIGFIQRLGGMQVSFLCPLRTIFVPWHCQMHMDAERGKKDAIPLFSFNETSPTAQGTGT